jgi:K+-transporting ATPase ATPase C chain
MKKNIVTAVLMTIATTILLGIIYPLVITGLAQAIFPNRANGQLIKRDGKVIGSRIIGQPFVGPMYFHSRPSAAGNGYDAANSGGTNLGPTNKKLIDRVSADVSSLHAENPASSVPIDLVTTSASGLDPDITPAAALFQVARIARERAMSGDQLRQLIMKHTDQRQLGFLGEPRVNVLELNLDLDQHFPTRRQAEARQNGLR